MAPKRSIDQVAPVAPEGEGNTIPPPKKRCNEAKNWVFTLHGSKTDDFWTEFNDTLKNVCDIAQYQTEIAPSTGAEHVQGFLKFKKKRRPMSVFSSLDNTIHWEVMRGTIEDNVHYTSKDHTRKEGGRTFKLNVPRVVEKVTWDTLSTENQDYLQPILDADYDYRTIYWIYDRDGNWGKSKMQKYLVDNHNAIMVAGAGKDIAYAIAKYHENNDRWPDFVLCNIPKSTKEEYISYGMLEQVKDGLVFSGKYESCQLRFPPVKLIVFANIEPAQGQWSDDRVKLYSVVGSLPSATSPCFNYNE